MANQSFLMWMRRRKKEKDTLAQRAGDILDLGKPSARKPTLEEWKAFLKEQGADLATKRAVNRLWDEYKAA